MPCGARPFLSSPHSGMDWTVVRDEGVKFDCQEWLRGYEDFCKSRTMPGRRLGRGDLFRGAQRDRRLDQSADITSGRSAVQPTDGGACREQARHRRVALVEDGAVAVDHDAAHGVGDGRADRNSIERRGLDRPGSVSVTATRRRKHVQRAGIDGSIVLADKLLQPLRRNADQAGQLRNCAGAM
jgi:hypothetical protein